MSPATDPRSERSACGIGFVADTGGTASRRIVEAGLEALGRMEHRGAVAGDGVSGDGAGILLPIPRELLGSGLPRSAGPPESLGVAMLFVGGDEERRAVPILERSCEAEGVGVAGWRTVPTDPSVLGPMAASSLPAVSQAILISPPTWSHEARRRASHRVRRRFERQRASAGLDVSVSSLSFDTVCYKALVRGGALAAFYPDLGDPRVVGWFAAFHQRYSTNTTPAWERAQPFRVLCHNGEINTLSGNVARMRQREGRFGSGDPAVEDLLSASVDDAGSDSSMLDEVVELLSTEGGASERARDIRHAVSMVLPRAVDNDPRVSEQVRAFVRWNETRMEPWDGPAAIVFADGRVVGAAMDRNGFRPLRYRVDSDGLVVCASETGVVDAGAETTRHGRLGPGDMLAVDPARGGLQLDPVGLIADERPYDRWLRKERVTALPTRRRPEHSLRARQIAAGLTREDLSIIVRPMASTGTEPTFAMGDDTPLPPLASQPRRVTAFLKQRFAQVTNPPLDHLRESWVMSLRTYLGARPELLDRAAARDPLVELPSFLLDGRPDGHLLDATWTIADGASGLEAALDRLAVHATRAAARGAGLLIIAGTPDRNTAVVPSVLALGATHSALERAGLRTATSLVVEAEDAWTSHEVACLLTCGADAVHLRLALATVEGLEREGRLGPVGDHDATRRYHHAIEDGVRKAMARLGISVLESYRGARALDAIGLHGCVLERCFPGVVSMVGGGVDLRRIGESVLAWHSAAFERGDEELASPGVVKFRRGGEYHASNPQVVRSFHAAVDPGLRRLRSTAAGADTDRPTASATTTLQRAEPPGGASRDDRAFARLVTLVERRPPTAPRDLLEILSVRAALPVSAVERADEITARFSTGAISLGAISREAHETLALGTRLAGARSNSGEGGEDPARFGTGSNSQIKQVASARFGVTPAYCMSAGELQIKIAQGSKPGEGGYLPGRKVTEEIAALRHTQVGIGLISPAPHHDIYSIEDLAQLVHDLKHVNPDAAVSVKLVAEAGVGTVAVGVAKAGADVVHVSGGDGGTGASPLSSIKHTGMPWESGLAEVSASLSEQGLRDRVRLRVDGGFRTGRDVVIAAMLGADEFSFGTGALLAEGCLMVRSCHLDTCPVGIATQRPELRARFAGTPEMVARYLMLVAEDVRRILASSGLRSVDDAIDRVDLLRPTGEGAGGLDVACLLRERRRGDGHHRRPAPRPPGHSLGDRVAEDGVRALAHVGATERRYVITNRDRSVGCGLGGAIARTFATDRPPGRFTARFAGDAGQSFGAFLSSGVAFHLVGTANDGVGKGMAGGTVAISPTSPVDGVPALIGDSALYGATGGELFVAGEAGQRFAVRNSGATSVVEGIGANGCEYMTGGQVLVLGPIGPNFAAGMTGGCAYILDPDRTTVGMVNCELVDVAALDREGMGLVERLLCRHLETTGSIAARDLLRSWASAVPRFQQVRPRTEAGEGSPSGGAVEVRGRLTAR